MRNAAILGFAVAMFAAMGFVLACDSSDDGDNGEVKGDISDLSEGALAEVEVVVLDDGTLYAAEIELGNYDEDEDDDDDDDDDDDEDEFEEEFTTTVDAVADDFTSFIVFGTLTVQLDLEDDDDDEDDEDEDEGELTIDQLSAGQWVTVDGLFSASDGIFHSDEVTAAGEEEAGNRLHDSGPQRFQLHDDRPHDHLRRKHGS
ncbi:MAG: DUF5666 domain-containing protein [Deltaproteobacteria bacterium]|nr:DUF5666 domain-containing protein [Deltaproteobacteria bacterium]